MGKTKTAFVGGVSEPEKSGKEVYEEKRKKKLEQERNKTGKEKQQVGGLGLKGGERIKVIGAEITEAETTETPSEEVKTVFEKSRKIKVRGKKYKSSKAKIDRSKLYTLSEAVKLVKETSYSKFDGSVEIHLLVKRVGISANLDLPYSSGKSNKIEVVDDKTLEKLKTGKIDFDILLATPDMMPKLVPFAKLLGPKGLMPNPKNATVIKSAKDASKFSGNTLSIKTEKEAPVIHSVIGKISQKNEELEKNLKAVIEAIDRKQILKAYIKASMGPSIKLQI